MLNKLYDLLRFNFSIFPGIHNYNSALFLKQYYDFRKKNQSVGRQLFNTLILIFFRLYAHSRAHRVAHRWSKNDQWRRWAGKVGASHFTDPNDLAMFNITSRRQLRYLYRRFEHIGCGRFIDNKMASDPTLFHDKFAFARFCQEHAIPHPKIYAHIHDGELETIDRFDDQAVVVAKPTYGTGGKGVFEINLKDAARLGDDGHRLLIERIISGHPGPYILQERI